MQPQRRAHARQLFPTKETKLSACWRLLPDTIQGSYRQEELALLVLGGGQVAFTYRSSSSAPCFA